MADDLPQPETRQRDGEAEAPDRAVAQAGEAVTRGRRLGPDRRRLRREHGMARGFTLTLLLLAAAVPAGAADVAAERASLGGAWTAVEAEREGAAAAELVGHRLEFAGDRFRISAGGEPLYAGTYALDPAARPARIDFRHDEGEAKGRIWEGIYRLEGGRLSICDDAPDVDRPRPAGFTTSPGSGHVLLVFER